MKESVFFLSIWLAGVAITSCQKKKKSIHLPSKPNIVVIYTGDMGYGDIRTHGAKGVSMPNIDKLADQGVDFIDAHSSAATCTPSQYSQLTGSFAFRQNVAILAGTAPLIFDLDRGTLPCMLNRAGYKTIAVGKMAFTMALRKGKWKYIAPQENPTPMWLKNKDVKTGLMDSMYLYNLYKDAAEQHNVASQNSQKVKQLQQKIH